MKKLSSKKLRLQATSIQQLGAISAAEHWNELTRVCSAVLDTCPTRNCTVGTLCQNSVVVCTG